MIIIAFAHLLFCWVTRMTADIIQENINPKKKNEDFYKAMLPINHKKENATPIL